MSSSSQALTLKQSNNTNNTKIKNTRNYSSNNTAIVSNNYSTVITNNQDSTKAIQAASEVAKEAINGMVQIAKQGFSSNEEIASIGQQSVKACINFMTNLNKKFIEEFQINRLESQVQILKACRLTWAIEKSSSKDKDTKQRADLMIKDLGQQIEKAEEKLDEAVAHKCLVEKMELEKETSRKSKIQEVRQTIENAIQFIDISIQNSSQNKLIFQIFCLSLGLGISSRGIHQHIWIPIIIFGSILACSIKAYEWAMVSNLKIKKHWMGIFIGALNSLQSNSEMTVRSAVLSEVRTDHKVDRARLMQNIPNLPVIDDEQNTSLDVFSAHAKLPPRQFAIQYY